MHAVKQGMFDKGEKAKGQGARVMERGHAEIGKCGVEDQAGGNDREGKITPPTAAAARLVVVICCCCYCFLAQIFRQAQRHARP